MSRYCLDTSAYSRFRRGEEAVVALVTTARWIGVPSIVLGELRYGFHLGSQRAANEKALAEFLAHPLVEVLAVDEDASHLYAALMNDLRRTGTPLPSNDVWIAALAAREGALVLTYDEHFRRIPRVGTRILVGGS